MDNYVLKAARVGLSSVGIRLTPNGHSPAFHFGRSRLRVSAGNSIRVPCLEHKHSLLKDAGQKPEALHLFSHLIVASFQNSWLEFSRDICGFRI